MGTKSGNMRVECTPIPLVHKERYVSHSEGFQIVGRRLCLSS